MTDPTNVRQHPTATRRRARGGTTPPPVPPPPPRPATIGRPRLLDDTTQNLIVGALRTGVPFREAAAVAGVTEQCAHGWKSRGAKALEAAGIVAGMEYDADEVLARIPETEHAFVEFSWAVASCSAARRAALLDKVHRDRDWRASAWLLKTGWPDDYGDRLELGGQVEVEVVDPRAALLARLERLRPGVTDTTAVEAPQEPVADVKPLGRPKAARKRAGGA
jgi:hypothetical protein